MRVCRDLSLASWSDSPDSRHRESFYGCVITPTGVPSADAALGWAFGPLDVATTPVRPRGTTGPYGPRLQLPDIITATLHQITAGLVHRKLSVEVLVPVTSCVSDLTILIDFKPIQVQRYDMVNFGPEVVATPVEARQF